MKRIYYHGKRFLLLLLLINSLFSLEACTQPFLLTNKPTLFPPQNLLITLDDLPLNWKVKFGPERAEDNSRSSDSAWISFSPISEKEKYLVLQMVFRYQNTRGAKADYADQIRFPENTEMEEWSFQSSVADESRFSCFIYSNESTPVCRWVARYERIVVDVIVRLEQKGLSIQEMETLVKKIDQKVGSILNQESEK